MRPGYIVFAGVSWWGSALGGNGPRVLQQHAEGGGAGRLQAHPKRRAWLGGAHVHCVGGNG